jgi:hypothetical protein
MNMYIRLEKQNDYRQLIRSQNSLFLYAIAMVSFLQGLGFVIVSLIDKTIAVLPHELLLIIGVNYMVCGCMFVAILYLTFQRINMLEQIAQATISSKTTLLKRNGSQHKTTSGSVTFETLRCISSPCFNILKVNSFSMFHFCGYGSVHVTGVSLDSL